MLLTFTSFFFGNIFDKHFTFFHFFNIFLEKSEVFMSKIFQQKTGKCQQHETNMILCLFDAADIYQFLFEPKITKIFIFFHFFNIFLEKSELFMNKFFKKKPVNASSMQQT